MNVTQGPKGGNQASPFRRGEGLSKAAGLSLEWPLPQTTLPRAWLKEMESGQENFLPLNALPSKGSVQMCDWSWCHTGEPLAAHSAPWLLMAGRGHLIPWACWAGNGHPPQRAGSSAGPPPLCAGSWEAHLRESSSKNQCFQEQHSAREAAAGSPAGHTPERFCLRGTGRALAKSSPLWHGNAAAARPRQRPLPSREAVC